MLQIHLALSTFIYKYLPIFMNYENLQITILVQKNSANGFWGNILPQTNQLLKNVVTTRLDKLV